MKILPGTLVTLADVAFGSTTTGILQSSRHGLHVIVLSDGNLFRNDCNMYRGVTDVNGSSATEKVSILQSILAKRILPFIL